MLFGAGFIWNVGFRPFRADGDWGAVNLALKRQAIQIPPLRGGGGGGWSGLPSGGDVPPSPWPAGGVVDGLGASLHPSPGGVDRRLSAQSPPLIPAFFA